MKRTVYIVDDDAAVRTALQRSIQMREFHVETFSSADEFLNRAIVSYPCCLILDVRMPGMSGLDLQDRLSHSESRIPIIFITGHGDIPMSVRTIKKGAVDFLEKPYRVEALMECVDKAMALSEEWQQSAEERKTLLSRYASLTTREQEVLKLLVAGAANASSKDIARDLAISHRTVDDHRARIMSKMQARSLTELSTMSKICRVDS